MGDTSNAPSDLGARIIKGDDAGEHGAVCIYNGQILLARFTARDIVPTLVEVREHAVTPECALQQTESPQVLARVLASQRALSEPGR